MVEENEKRRGFIIKTSIRIKELRTLFFTATMVPTFLGAIIA